MMKEKLLKRFSLHNNACEKNWDDEHHLNLIELHPVGKEYHISIAVGKYDTTAYTGIISPRGIVFSDITLGEPEAELSLSEVEDLINEVAIPILFPRVAIGARLRALREAKGLTTRELAERCGLIHSHIVRIESGRYGFSIDTLDKLTTALGAHINLESYE